MASTVQSRGDSSPILLSQSQVPTWEVETPTLRGIFVVELFNYNPPPPKVEETIQLALKAKSWQDLTKTKAIFFLKWIAIAILVTLTVLNAIFINFHWAAAAGLAILGGFAWHHILFGEDDTLLLFSIRPDWEELDRERLDLYYSYNSQMQNHIALLTAKIEQEERIPTPHREDRLGRLITGRDTLQRLWNWVEKGQ